MEFLADFAIIGYSPHSKTHSFFMIKNNCLNGWWNFLPVETTTELPAQVPATGWNPEAVLTPSWWTKSRFAVRRRGERQYRCLPKNDIYHEDRPCDGALRFSNDHYSGQRHPSQRSARPLFLRLGSQGHALSSHRVVDSEVVRHDARRPQLIDTFGNVPMMAANELPDELLD